MRILLIRVGDCIEAFEDDGRSLARQAHSTQMRLDDLPVRHAVHIPREWLKFGVDRPDRIKIVRAVKRGRSQ